MPVACQKTFADGGINWAFVSDDNETVFFGGSNCICGTTCINKASLLRHQVKSFCLGNEERLVLKDFTKLVEGYHERHKAGEDIAGFAVDKNGEIKLGQKFRQRPDAMKILAKVVESANGLQKVVLSSKNWTVFIATLLGDGVEDYMSRASAAIAHVVTKFVVEGNFLGFLSERAGRDIFLNVLGVCKGLENTVTGVVADVVPRLVDAASGLPRVGASGPRGCPRAHVGSPNACTAAPRRATAPLASDCTWALGLHVLRATRRHRAASPEAPRTVRAAHVWRIGLGRAHPKLNPNPKPNT